MGRVGRFISLEFFCWLTIVKAFFEVCRRVSVRVRFILARFVLMSLWVFRFAFDIVFCSLDIVCFFISFIFFFVKDVMVVVI